MPPIARGTRANPRDLTGRTHRANLEARAKELEQRDYEAEIKQAREDGFNNGWDAAIAWVIKHYELDNTELSEEEIA